MHILIPWRKHMQSFKKIGTKLQEELRSQDTQGKCWRMDERTETWMPKSPMLNQVQQKPCKFVKN